MDKLLPLEHGCYYHIYNRGINGTSLFPDSDFYNLFLKTYAHYTEPIFDTYAYCLLNNHFHLMVRVRELAEVDIIRWKQERGWKKISEPSRHLSHFFNSYAQKVNAITGRTGSLFEKQFHRELIDRDSYFSQLVFYIHSNPFKHGFTNNYRTYPHSSYLSHLSDKPTLLKRDLVLDWFGGRQQFIDFHEGMSQTQFPDFRDC